MDPRNDKSIAIVVDRVSKQFLLPHNRPQSLKHVFTRLLNLRPSQDEIQDALKDISFSINKGEFFGIVGRNGGGKSTLLKILAGIYQPTKGGVFTRGKLVPFIELGVGFNPDLTGKENVFLNGSLLGFSKKQVEDMYDSIVEFAELERFMDQKLKNYSSGMQVRLAFSMAIRANADILLIDEVLAVGDAAFQRKCLEYFRKLKKDKKTVVFVSHDMDSVRQFCDRAVLIDKTRVVKIGNPDEIAESYSRLFVEDVEKNITAKESHPELVRRGAGGVRFWNVHQSHKVLRDDAKIIISGYLRADEEVERPIIGFRIIDDSGRLITGTNSLIMKVDTGKLGKGDRVKFSWDIPNIFSNGKYTISMAIITAENKELDVWPDALSFEVVKPMKTPYIVTPLLKLTVDKDK